jgi:hypothetical protein
MFIEKLQMLFLACVNTYHKCFWLQQWNQYGVIKLRNSQNKDFQMPLLINGFIELHFGTKFDFQLKSYYCFPCTNRDMVFGMLIIF